GARQPAGAARESADDRNRAGRWGLADLRERRFFCAGPRDAAAGRRRLRRADERRRVRIFDGVELQLAPARRRGARSRQEVRGDPRAAIAGGFGARGEDSGILTVPHAAEKNRTHLIAARFEKESASFRGDRKSVV